MQLAGCLVHVLYRLGEVDHRCSIPPMILILRAFMALLQVNEPQQWQSSENGHERLVHLKLYLLEIQVQLKQRREGSQIFWQARQHIV